MGMAEGGEEGKAKAKGMSGSLGMVTLETAGGTGGWGFEAEIETMMGVGMTVTMTSGAVWVSASQVCGSGGLEPGI
jgi:hypothetical protein